MTAHAWGAPVKGKLKNLPVEEVEKYLMRSEKVERKQILLLQPLLNSLGAEGKWESSRVELPLKG